MEHTLSRDSFLYIFMFLLMFLGILAVRRLMKENVLLKENLQKRSVELGAVSSYLLTPCYDAVVEVDQNFKLTQEPGLPRIVAFNSF